MGLVAYPDGYAKPAPTGQAHPKTRHKYARAGTKVPGSTIS
jgi:hypothetical protein